MSGRNEVFRVRSPLLFWRWLSLLLLIALTVATLILLAVSVRGPGYPDGDLLTFFGLLSIFLWIVWAAHAYRLITSIQLLDDSFVLKNMGQKSGCYPFGGILSHNERLNHDNAETVNELTVYLANSWFAIRSNEFDEYEYLKKYFTQYGQPVPHRNALTVFERNRLRWLIGGLVLLIGASIALGFVMHNPADPNPARLISLNDTVEQVRENRNKSRLTGVTICLRAFPHFAFYVSRRNYDVSLVGLPSAITPKRPVTLLIRESEFRKKLRGSEPLTFGDKYDDYNQIMVFDVNQGDSVRIQTPNPVYEPTHTNPLLRTSLLSVLLQCCWTGWIYVDRQPVLREQD